MRTGSVSAFPLVYARIVRTFEEWRICYRVYQPFGEALRALVADE